ncbi:MAG: ExbD/TolR family protein [Planctomycetota bacterium]
MEMHKFIKQDAHVDQDMTPMIDIVFLLIIFFMVVTELTLDQAEVILPVATEAKVEEPQPGSRTLTINISFDSETGKEMMQIGGGDKLSPEELTNQLKLEAAAFDKWEPNPNDRTVLNSLLEVVVRCDEGAKSGMVHKIYQACQTAKIFKVRVAALNERLEDPYGG